MLVMQVPSPEYNPNATKNFFLKVSKEKMLREMQEWKGILTLCY
jgi:hypothetical protein